MDKSVLHFVRRVVLLERFSLKCFNLRRIDEY